jgi:hypothetical protein
MAAIMLLAFHRGATAQDRIARIPEDGLRRILVSGTASVAMASDMAELTACRERRGCL